MKQRLVKWFLATLDAEIEGYQKLTLASYLDGELAILVAVTISASSPLSINLDNLMIFFMSKSHASSSLYSHLSTRFIMQSLHSRSLSPWDDEELEVRSSIQALLNQRYLRNRAWLDKSQEFLYNIASNLPDDRFRQFYRVSRDAFNILFDRIQDHPVFTLKQ